MNILPVVIFIIALTGDGLFFRSQPVGYAWAVGGLGAMAWAGWLLLARRASLWPHWAWLRWLLLAAAVSTATHPAIYQAGLGRWFLLLVALAALALAQYYQPDVLAGLYRAGWLYIAVAWFGDFEFRNVAGFWAMLFFLAGFSMRSWLYVCLYTALLLYFGSRGAILGAAAGLVVYLWPFIRPRLAMAPLGLAGLAGLAWLRPDTTLIRLHYWSAAFAAFWSSPIFGVGLGGLKADKLIYESADMYQIHAHNALITWLAQAGLIGVICAAMALYHVLRFTPRLTRWQYAILSGLAAHSMVDEPLFWPGPLLVTAAMISYRPLAKS